MEFDFKKYVLHQRAVGRSDKQIATSLGMSLKHFLAKVEEVENKNPIIATFKKQMTDTIIGVGTANTFLKPKKNKETEVVKAEPVEETKEPEPVVEES